MSWKDRATPIAAPTETSDWKSRASSVPAPTSDWKTRASSLIPPAPEDAIQKEIEQRGFLDRPLIVPQQVTDEELKQIAGKYGTSAEDLRSALPFLGGLPEEIKASDVLKGAAGFAGEAVALGAPQKLYRMAQDPKQEAALDELKDLVSGRKSALQMGAELLAPGVGLAKVAKTAGGGLKGAAAAGAVAGAVGGFGASKAGEEITGTVVGAGLGAGVGAIANKIGQRLEQRAARKLTETEQAAIKNLEPDLGRLQEEATTAIDSKPGNAVIQDYVTGIKNLDDLTVNDAIKITDAELTPKAIEAYADINTKKGLELYKGLDEAVVRELGPERAATLQLARDVINQQRSSFVEKVLGKKTSDPAALEEAIQDLSRQKTIVPQYRDYRIGQKMDEMAEVRGLHNVEPESKAGQIFSKLSDALFVLRTIDEKFKTSLELVLGKLSKNRNLMTEVTTVNNKIIDSIYDFAEKNGTVQAAKSGKIFDAIDQGKLELLTDAEKETAQKITQEFQRLYKFITSDVEQQGITGLNIPEVKNYVARMSMSVPETIAKVEMEVTSAVNQANKLLGTNYKNINQLSSTDFVEVENLPAFKNLKYYLQWVKGSPEPIKFNSAADLSKAINESIRSETDIKMLDRVARGSMERTAEVGGIPDFIKEKDIFNVMSRYSHDMLSTLYQREPLQEMKFIADRLDKLNAKNEAQYVRNIVEDTWGVRKGTVAHYMRDVKGQIARKLDPKIEEALRRGDTTTAFVLNSIKEMQDLPGYLSRQIYNNVLGWRPVPITQNLVSGLARTAPELGTKYGYTAYFRGLIHTMANFKSLIQEVRATGLVPAEFTRNGQRAIADGIRASKAVDTTVRGFDALGKLGMSLYELSENINRATILSMSKIMAHDLGAGSKLAQGALEKFPSSVRRAIARSGNDPKTIESIIATHLNQSTAFNYNRPSLYEFGRTMGPMFSTFAKWPTAIAGEIGSEIRTKGLPRGIARSAERYALPLISLGVADYFLQDKLEDNDRMQAIVGKTGLKKAAPISSLGGFVAGDIFTPPMIDTVMQDIVIPATKAEGVKLVKGLDRTAFTYLPGAGFVKFLTDFVPTVVTGERPEGPTQTERTLRSTGILK